MLPGFKKPAFSTIIIKLLKIQNFYHILAGKKHLRLTSFWFIFPESIVPLPATGDIKPIGMK
jgi:hypothetical protein